MKYWLSLSMLVYDWSAGKHPPRAPCEAKEFLASLSEQEIESKLAQHGLRALGSSPIRFLRSVVLVWHLNG